MKAMYAGFAAIVVISLVAWYGLGQAGFSSEDRHSGNNVRLSDS
ncbi:MAG: hypothetical protein OIF48_07650 [Silicimonas sp.]|nr:hypothetical protein [Silicimonas sp.]